MKTVYADAYGFNAIDATAALQAAIDSGADKVIVRNQGVPWLISKTIRLKSNQEIRFEPDVVVQAKSGSFLDNKFPMFQALSINNIKLVGEGVGVRQATLAMNKNEFTDTNPDSYGHIIAVQGTANYTISGLTLTGAGGDGIIIDSASYGQPIPTPNTLNYSDNGLIDNITSTGNRRNGMAVISAQNLTVQNSKFINSSPTSPATGIDVEPDFSYNRLSNINFNNLDISGNKGHGLALILSAIDNNSTPISININGAKIDSNEATGIKIGSYQTFAYQNSNNPNSTANGVINISNVAISNTKATFSFYDEPNAAISVEALSGDLSDPNNVKINFSNVAISNTGVNIAKPQLSAEPIFIRGFGGSNNRNQIGNLSFDNVTVADNFNRSIVGVYLNQPGSFNNITGDIKGINPYGVTTNITSTAKQNNFTLKVTPDISPVVANSGNDTFNPGKGAIAIDGGAGNDRLIINNSADPANTIINYINTASGRITGGFNDGTTFKNIESLIFTSGSGSANVNISATTGNNNINVSAATGSFGNVGITTGVGNDIIIGSLTGKFNNYNSGDGNDVLTAGNGSGNNYNGGAGNDTFIAEGGSDTLSGGSGNDTYIVNNTTNTITESFNEGTDIVQSSVSFSLAAVANVENLTLTGTAAINGTGNAANNTLIGNNAGNSLYGATGDDTIFGELGDDYLAGGAGNDILNGGEGIDTLEGGEGNDILNGDAGNDVLRGGAGADVHNGGDGIDCASYYSSTTAVTADLTTPSNNTGDAAGDTFNSIECLQGSLTANSTLTGDGNNNTIISYNGNDVLNGGAGDDYLIAGAGNDILTGGNGNDILVGGTGSDFLTGGLGKDKFSYQTGAMFNDISIDIDTITDFTIGDDTLVLSKTTFTKLVGGLTFANVANDSAVNSNAAFVVYSKASGKLFYNENGAGLNLGSGGQFAQLTSGLNLTSNDFELVS